MKVLEIAGAAPADARGWVLGRHHEPIDCGSLARVLGFDGKVLATALDILTNPAVGWLEWAEYPALELCDMESPGTPGIPGRAGDSRSTGSLQEDKSSQDKTKQKDSAEPPRGGDSAPTSADNVVFCVFPVSGEPEEWALTRGKLREYHRLYGKQIDVGQEARAARQWAVDNPQKRKTAGGMPGFLGRWMRRAVDSGSGARPRGKPRKAKAPDRPEWMERRERLRQRYPNATQAELAEMLAGEEDARKQAQGIVQETAAAIGVVGE